MKIDDIDKAFKNYIDEFDMNNENIKLKYEHTLEVVNVMDRICNLMRLNEEDKTLAKTIAYLHDIGRFEQIVKTNSFQDSIMDHADNGVDLLFNRNLIEKFNIDKKYYTVIEKAIRNHNKLAIIDKLDNEEELFVKLIRDADKIDIYRVRVKYLKNKFIGEVTDINLNDFYKHKSIDLKNKQTKSDAILCVIAFVFDINYSESINVLKELGYFDKFIDNIEVEDSNTKVFNKIKEEVYKYLEERDVR